MAKLIQVTRWQADAGPMFDTQIEALAHDASVKLTELLDCPSVAVVRTIVGNANTVIDILQHMWPRPPYQAHEALKELYAEMMSHDGALNDHEIIPTTGDYNFLFTLVQRACNTAGIGVDDV